MCGCATESIACCHKIACWSRAVTLGPSVVSNVLAALGLLATLIAVVSPERLHVGDRHHRSTWSIVAGGLLVLSIVIFCIRFFSWIDAEDLDESGSVRTGTLLAMAAGVLLLVATLWRMA